MRDPPGAELEEGVAALVEQRPHALGPQHRAGDLGDQRAAHFGCGLYDPAGGVGDQWHLGVAPFEPLHDFGEPRLDRLHQRAVEGGAHLKSQRAGRSRLRGELDRLVNRGLLSGDDDLNGQLMFAGETSPASEARSQSDSSTACGGRPMIAAIAPGRSDWIAAISRPRSETSSIPCSTLRTPAATAAVYSPRL